MVEGATVQSVSKSLDLLEAIAQVGGASPISALAEETGLSLGTTHRLIRTLVGRGYVAQLPDKRYCLGTRLVPLGVAANARMGQRAVPVMTRLVDEIGESVNIAMLANTAAEYIQQSEGTHSLRLFTEIGRQVPLHSTSAGKAMLSTMSGAQVRRIVARTGLTGQAPNTITDVPALLDDLATTRERGWAMDDEEMEAGVRCIAAPIRADTVMALSISGPTSRMTPDTIARAVPLLLLARDALQTIYAPESAAATTAAPRR